MIFCGGQAAVELGETYLNTSAESAAARWRFPMLLQCDWHGQVLWMSDNTRSVLGNLENLAGAFQDPGGSPYTGPSRFSWLFSRI